MSEPIVDVEIRSPSPERRGFIHSWESVAPFANQPELDIFPNGVVEDIPFPSPSVKEISVFDSDSTSLVKGKNDQGDTVVFPATKHGRFRRPVVIDISIDEFEEHYHFRPTPKKAELMKRYYELNATLTGGLHTGLMGARILQAISIADQMAEGGQVQPEVDRQLEKDFGLTIAPNEARSFFSEIEKAMKAADAGHFALEYTSENGRTPMQAARDLIQQRPLLFLTYLIKKTSSLMHAKQEDRDDLYLNSLVDLARKAEAINVGQLHERDDLVYNNINDAITFIKQLYMIHDTPHAYALANEAVSEAIDLHPALRFNSLYVTIIFNKMLIDSGFIDEKMLDSKAVMARASVKTPRSLMLQTFLNEPELRNRVRELAEGLGVDKPVLTNAEFRDRFSDGLIAIRNLNAIISRGLEKDLDQEHYEQIGNLVDNLRESMSMQNELIRAKVFFRNPADLNNLAKRADKRLRTFSDVQREQLGDRAGGLMFASSDTQEGSEPKIFALDQIDEEFDNDPADWMMDWFLKQPKKTSTYVAAHYYFPFKMNADRVSIPSSREVKRASAGLSGLEFQLVLQPMRAPNDLHRLIYIRADKRLTGIEQRLVDEVQENARFQIEQLIKA